MVTSGTKTKNRAVALAASVALGSGSLVAMAPVASAAPGDTSVFLMSGQVTDVAEGPSGSIWVAALDGTVSKIGLDREVINYATTAAPFSIAQGPAGQMWFTDSGSSFVGRISSEGAVQYYPTGVGNSTEGIALGADGNMWFTAPADSKVGKISPAGDVTLYDTGGVPMRWITPGPEGSNRMYMSEDGNNNLGFITFNGNFTLIPGPANAGALLDIQRVNDQIWFTSRGGVSLSTLTGLVGDSGFSQVANGALDFPWSIGAGSNGTMWLASQNLPNGKVSHVRTNGEVVASYDFAFAPETSPVQAQDGTVWFGSGTRVYRMTTELVPTSTAAPAVEPTTGLVAGSTATVTNGTWTYLPGNYAYQWQVCGSSDAASCADVPGAAGQSYTVATADVGKYIRAGVRASNLNGASQPAYSALVATGAAPAPQPDPNPTPVPATGEVASIGNGVVMELDAPSQQKRKQRKTYEVFFSATDVQGTVVFEFSKGKRTKTKTVTVEDGLAEYRWKTPRKWRKGRTTVTATFIPAAGSPYTAAETRDRVRIR